MAGFELFSTANYADKRIVVQIQIMPGFELLSSTTDYAKYNETQWRNANYADKRIVVSIQIMAWFELLSTTNCAKYNELRG
jgi:hypothetical protein